MPGFYLVRDNTGTTRKIKGTDSSEVQPRVEKKFGVQVVSIERLPASQFNQEAYDRRMDFQAGGNEAGYN